MIAEFFRFVDNHWDVFVETRKALWNDGSGQSERSGDQLERNGSCDIVWSRSAPADVT